MTPTPETCAWIAGECAHRDYVYDRCLRGNVDGLACLPEKGNPKCPALATMPQDHREAIECLEAVKYAGRHAAENSNDDANEIAESQTWELDSQLSRLRGEK